MKSAVLNFNSPLSSASCILAERYPSLITFRFFRVSSQTVIYITFMLTIINRLPIWMTTAFLKVIDIIFEPCLNFGQFSGAVVDVKAEHIAASHTPFAPCFFRDYTAILIIHQLSANSTKVFGDFILVATIWVSSYIIISFNHCTTKFHALSGF